MGSSMDGLDSGGTPAKQPHRDARWPRCDPWLIPAAALALIPIIAIAQPGLPHTADGYVHLLRALEVSELLAGGVFYPSWAPHFYFGYGYPFFNFYAPGAHLAAGLLALTGLGVLRGIVALQMIALLLYPTGAYLAGRSLLAAVWDQAAARPIALLSAALYLYAPLRFRELFTQGNLSQLLALGLLPWCAWLLAEAIVRRDLRWSATAGGALAALVYAHHPSAFLGFPILAAYALALALTISRNAPASGGAPAGWLAGLAAFPVGVLLSAAFWLPAVLELREVNITAIETGMFNARLNLLPPAELLAPAVVLDDAALNPPQPNSLGLFQAALALAGLITAAIWIVRPRDLGPGLPSRRRGGLMLGSIAGLLILSLALMTPVAAPIWEHLPLARFIAFPWRLLGPALLCAALLGAAGPTLLPARARLPGLLLLLLLAPLSVAPYLFPRPFAPTAEPTLADLARYELEGGARATASANEYLPRWVQDPDPPTDLAEALLAGQPLDRLDRTTLPAGSHATLLMAGPLEDVYRLSLPQTTTLQLRRFYFPGWHAWLDGHPVVLAPSAPFGLIAITAPAGEHELRVRYEMSPVRRAGVLVMLVGCAAAAGLWQAGRRMPRPRVSAPVGAGWPTATALILALTALTTLWIGPRTRWFRMRSAADAPATMQHAVHARFTNGVELLGYDLAGQAVRQGGTLTARLYWRALTPQHENLRPFLHLDAITGTATWANQTRMHPGDKPTTTWVPGFYVVDDYRLAVPNDTPAVIAELRVGLLDGRGERVSLEGGGDQVTLTRLHIQERRPLEVPRRRDDTTYRLGNAVELVGHTVAVDETAGGQAVLNVTLYWRANEAVEADYTVFVHVLDSTGARIVQGDGPPVGGLYPTGAWRPGQVIADQRRVLLPKGTSPDGLRVAVGLYRLEDGVRLPVVGRDGTRRPDDQIVLTVTANSETPSPRRTR